METAKLLGLTNVGIWLWATLRLLTVKDPRPFSKLLVLSIGVDFLKRGFRQLRPRGAKACDALGIGGISKSFGLPSGHVATAVAGWMMIAESFNVSKQTKWLIGLLAGLLMGWARVTAGCHTPLQSALGALFGAAVVTA